MADDKISLDILTERPIVRNDQVSELDMVIEVGSKQAIDSRTEKRKALNLCLVIDRSGSMQGQKLETAKKSCIDIYKRLNEDDLLTVVVFDDDAQSVVNPKTSKDEVIQKLTAINSRGCTNLSLGWYLGLLELQTYKTDNHINKLILLSDGLANRGETKKTVLASESLKARDLGITTSTIGIGDDFSEEILEALASESGGRFWFIQESSIEDIINEEFKGSLSVIVERPRIQLELPDGVKISKQLNDVRKIGNQYRIRPINGGYLFNFAFRMEFQPTLISYPSTTLKAVLYDGENPIQETEKKVFVKPVEEYVVSGENPIVRSVVQQYESSKTDEVMMKMIDEGDFDFMRKMIVQEMEGMRVVKDKLEMDRIEPLTPTSQETATQSEDTLFDRYSCEAWDVAQSVYKRETYHMGKKLQEDGNMLLILNLCEMTENLKKDTIFFKQKKDRFLGKLRKMLTYRMHNNKSRFYDHKIDEQQQIVLLQEALEIADDLIKEFPQKTDLLELRKKIYDQLERYR
jgi:Ca-activated chloride channel family protein